MKLLVTGATGFVGRYTVAAAVDAGHRVRALVRPAGTAAALGRYESDPSVEIVRGDLRSPAGLDDAVNGVDAVVHLAAAKEGDFATQFAGTVLATENLLGAMTATGVERLVGVSTFSVYDYRAMRNGELVTEDSPIDETPARRDEYAQTKLLQEKLYRRFGSADHVVILRPGMIYGRGNLWHALLGADIGPRFVKIGSRAVLPLTYVENCALAFVLAAEGLATDPSTVDGEVINIVDDDLPTQHDYAAAVEAATETPPSRSVPWPVVNTMASLLDRGNHLFLDGRAKLPGIAIPDRLHARFKPLSYTNEKAKRLLGWTPTVGLADAIERSVGVDPALTGAPETARG
ncbi:MAG: NAD-dependent epimerase/dehydratase family protein [Acidimicrobiales bacterium]